MRAMVVANAAQRYCPGARRVEQGGCRVWMRFAVIVLLLMGSAFLVRDVAAADRTSPLRIAALTASWGPSPQIVGLRDGLVALGYREEQDFVLGVRFTQGNLAALPAAARQLVQYGVDLIFVDSDESAKAAQQATTQIPIVFANVSDPEGLGTIESFARPGGNMTGVTDLELNLGPKRLQIFQELIPSLKRVLFPYDTAEAYAVRMARVYGEAAQHLSIEFIAKAVHTQDEARATLAAVRHGDVDGILAPSSFSLNMVGLILEAGARQAIPAMYSTAFLVEQGGLASYGSDNYDTGKQAARLVDKIFKGAKPADIPVEVNPKIAFAINLKTAKALGLTIAPDVLFQADRVVR